MPFRDNKGEQDKLVNREPGPVFIYYKQIQDESLKSRSLTETDVIRSFRSVIDGFDRQTGLHKMSDVDLDDNPEMLIERLFDSYPDRDEMAGTMLLNNFCNNMETSARQSGKYAILVVMGDSIFVCHADSAEKTITKDADVIERLLDTDNVDKYAEFRQGDEEEIRVRHYERQPTKSLSGWLGIQEHEIAYGDAGDIKIQTEVDGATCTFQFTKDEFVEEIQQGEEFEIVNELFKTPSGNE
jgi:hypothetical protein